MSTPLQAIKSDIEAIVGEVETTFDFQRHFTIYFSPVSIELTRQLMDFVRSKVKSEDDPWLMYVASPTSSKHYGKCRLSVQNIL